MVLVLVTALGIGIPLSRLNLSHINDLRPRIFLLGSFLLLVVAKFGLLIGLQLKRSRTEQSAGPDSIPGSGSERHLS